MPSILRNLKILEVSSVDRGAGEGVKVVLMKRDDVAKHTESKTADASASKSAADEIDLASIEVGKSDDIDLAAIA